MANVHYSNKTKYISPHIGGRDKLDIETIKNQEKSIDDSNKNNNFDSDYDIYNDYLTKNGLVDQKNKKNRQNNYLVEYENINSVNRITDPYCSINNSILLNNNPFQFKSLTNNNLPTDDFLYVNSSNNNLQDSDNITLTGLNNYTNIINSDIVVLSSDTLTTLYGTLTTTTNIIFTDQSTYVKICLNPNIYTSNLTTMINKIPLYDFSNVMVTITGFQGSTQYVAGGHSLYFGNIPINDLNNMFQIYLYNPSTGTAMQYDGNSFFINLPSIFNASFITPPTTDTFFNIGYNISFQFNHICGIPINYINAQYPLNNNFILGYQSVYSANNNGFYIKLNKPWLGDNVGNPAGTNFGGNLIYYSQINQIYTGYPYPNNYTINLRRSYKKVIQMCIINSIFPATEYVFDNTYFTNTTLYWQNKNDGSYIYSINITPGTYDTVGLKAEIEAQIQSTKKSLPQNISQSITGIQSQYSIYNYITIDFNTNNNITTLSSYNKYIFLTPPITNISLLLTNSIPSYSITINQPGHNMAIGDIITFSGMIDIVFTISTISYGILASDLNSQFTVNTVVDSNTYTIVLSNTNLINNPTITCTDGGYNVTGLVNAEFRLLFNRNNTMGANIGFRNVGDSMSITSYNTVIQNIDPYYNEPIINQYGVPTNFNSGRINLNRSNYIQINCENMLTKLNQLSDKQATSVIGKINCSKIKNGNYYDTFVYMPLNFYTPIDLYKLNLSFYDPSGNLINFGLADHSFVLEITSIVERPYESYIDSKTGIKY